LRTSAACGTSEGCELDLAPESADVEARGQLGREDLHDHSPTQRGLLGDEHTTHATAELALDAVGIAKSLLQLSQKVGQGLSL
jgi:hypothetical protein